MNVLEGPEDALEDCAKLALIKRTFKSGHNIRKSTPITELHNQPESAFREEPTVVIDDAGVAQVRNHVHFLKEWQPIGLKRNNFDGDNFVRTLVQCFEH
jgi:hypothetical protein